MARKKKTNEELEIIENDIEQQNRIRELEEFYVNGTVGDLLPKIEEKKEELVKDMILYHDSHIKECKWDKDGNPLKWETEINPIVITNKFFKPIIPIMGQEPIYNAESLGLVFNYYIDLLTEVNDKIGNFPSSLTLFCKFSGISLYTLKKYKNSDDYSMRVVAEKIYDQIGDENITMSQMGVVRERTTLFKMKSQNEMVEKAQPQVKVNVNADIDMDKIQEKINKYKQFATKKEK